MPSLGGVLPVALVAFVVVASFDYPLALRGTVGPVGGYAIADTTGYVSETNAVEHESIRQGMRARPPYGDLAEGLWSSLLPRDQQLDVTPLEASLNHVLGLGATDTQSPFLIVILLVIALGAYGVVRNARAGPAWPAVVAGCLVAGPLFVELFMDGSQAAIAGCATLIPLVALGTEAARRPTPATLVLFALLAAGLQTLYPLFVPTVVLAGAAVLGVAFLRAFGRRSRTRPQLGAAIVRLLAVLALAAAFTPVAFVRNVHYWISLLNGSFSLAGLPGYVLPVNVLPGWLLQSREFYSLVDLRHASAGQLFMGGLLPAVFIAVIVVAVVRHRRALTILAVAGGASLLAYYTWTSRDCSYCVQRNLIPVAAVVPVALGLGLAAVAELRRPVGLLLAAAVAVAVVIAVGHEGIVERQRLADGAYMLDQRDRTTLAALPSDAAPVELEGFGQGSKAPMELPLVYNLVDERTGGQVSVPTETDDFGGLFYLGGAQPLGPSFKPYYGFVLTRLGGVQTERRVIARDGPIALEQRRQALDATITGGVSVAASRFDAAGSAWVSNPLHFLVLGGAPGSPASVWLTIAHSVPATVVAGPGVSAVRRSGSTLRICLAAQGDPPVRRASVQLHFTPQPVAPPEPYADPLPPRGVRLVAMDVTGAACPRH
jgi:hypothetical protein